LAAWRPPEVRAKPVREEAPKGPLDLAAGLPTTWEPFDFGLRPAHAGPARVAARLESGIVAAGDVPASWIDASRRARLLARPDPAVAAAAEAGLEIAVLRAEAQAVPEEHLQRDVVAPGRRGGLRQQRGQEEDHPSRSR
jgi:hypothetical protein